MTIFQRTDHPEMIYYVKNKEVYIWVSKDQVWISSSYTFREVFHLTDKFKHVNLKWLKLHGVFNKKMLDNI